MICKSLRSDEANEAWLVDNPSFQSVLDSNIQLPLPRVRIVSSLLPVIRSGRASGRYAHSTKIRIGRYVSIADPLPHPPEAEDERFTNFRIGILLEGLLLGTLGALWGLGSHTDIFIEFESGQRL